MKGLLSELLKFLWHQSGDISVMVMDIFQNVLGHLKKREASAMVVKVVQRLRHLFDTVRLMWESEPCSRALGNDSCPSAQPCK